MDAALGTTAIEETVHKTTEKLVADFSKVETNIHRFPAGLRGICGQGDRYIVPSVVALGPYHHGLPHLQEMEEVKHAAAHCFCRDSGHSTKAVYEKILSAAGDARLCYAAADAAVARLSDAEFAAMMFLDGCFLLQFLMGRYGPRNVMLENRISLSTGLCMLRDMMLLENQIPWLVLDALMSFWPVPVDGFVGLRATGAAAGDQHFAVGDGESSYSCRPPHLLGLVRFYHIAGKPAEDIEKLRSLTHNHTSLFVIIRESPRLLNRSKGSMSVSAIELAEIGVKLTASKAAWLGDMSVKRGPLFGELSLTPLFLDDVNACWLVNMAALEACTATSFAGDGFVVSSYLSLLAMLMNKEQDAHELRAKRIVHSFFSDQEILGFFKGIAQHLRLGDRYFAVLGELEAYKRDRPVRIVVHKFMYHNLKTIAAVLSVIGVLAGIFKTLLSLKQQQQQPYVRP